MIFFFFFFQAEDGIRDVAVTGVQTCALPISGWLLPHRLGTATASSTASLAAEELKPYTETIPGTGVKFEMIPIAGGTFTMGTPPGEFKRSDDEGPQHQVTIHAFWMEKTETTWDEYDV